MTDGVVGKYLAVGGARGGLAALTLVVLLAPLALAWLPRSADQPAAEIPQTASLFASLAIAAAAAVLAVALGGLCAAALVFAQLPARALWATLLLIPFVTPPTVWTLAQVACFGRGGLIERWLGDGGRPALAAADSDQYLATTLVLAQIHAPLAMLIVLRGLDRLQRTGLDAARLFFSGRSRLVWLLRALRQEILSASLVSFALALANFSVPHVMQCRLYIIDVYMRSANYLDQLGALKAALPLVAVALAAALGFAWLDRGVAYASATSDPPHRGRTQPVAACLLGVYLMLTIVLPIAALAADCRSFEQFFDAVQAAGPETLNTLLIGGGAALAACLAAGIVAPWSIRRGLVTPELLAMLPLGLPPLVIGLAYARTYHQPWPTALAAIADTSLLAMLGLACRGLPFAVRILAAGARRQAREWDEAARLSEMSIGRRWRWVVGPLWLNHAATAAIVVFVLAAGDVEVSHLLTAPGSGTLAMRLFTFLHFGPAHVTASLALWQMIVVLAPVLVYFLLTDRWLHLL